VRSLYTPIRAASDLPREGPIGRGSSERHDLDFKAYASKERLAEHGKDIAAFANTLGGTILVGAAEVGGTLSFAGVSSEQSNPTIKQTPGEVVRYYEQAAQTMCMPRPHVETVVLRYGEVELVAINVEPYVGVIATKAYVDGPDKSLRVVERAWRYPYRVGSQTEFYDPGELWMYSDPSVRRATILLSQIPDNAIVWVSYEELLQRGQTQRIPTRRVAEGLVLEESKNRVTMEILKSRVAVPLRDIRDVWPEVEAYNRPVWSISVGGTFQMQAPPHLPTAAHSLIYFSLR